MQYKAAGYDVPASGPSSASAPGPRDSPNTTERNTEEINLSEKIEHRFSIGRF